MKIILWQISGYGVGKREFLVRPVAGLWALALLCIGTFGLFGGFHALGHYGRPLGYLVAIIGFFLLVARAVTHVEGVEVEAGFLPHARVVAVGVMLGLAALSIPAVAGFLALAWASGN